MKTCVKCGLSQPFDQFRKSATSAGGLRPDCKSCQAAYAAERYRAAAAPLNPPAFKSCSVCGELKPLGDFYKNAANRTDGRHSRCRTCMAATAAAKWRRPAPEDVPTEKACRTCAAVKPLDQFHKDGRGRDGRALHCIACLAIRSRTKGREYRAANRDRANAASRAWNAANPDARRDQWLRSKYGISSSQYDAMHADHNGLCAICSEPGEESYRGLRVDHDHQTGQVRGLLCHSCNVALGFFKDDPELLAKAIDYLLMSDAIRQMT